MITKFRSLTKRFPAYGLALVASLAFAGLFAGNAAALSMSPGAGVSFAGSGGALSMSTGAWTVRTCEGSDSAATATSSTEGEIKLGFTGCKASLGGSACTSAGQPSGRIVSNSLKYRLVYLDAAKTKFGLMLIPSNASVYNYPPPFDGNNGKIIPGSGTFAQYVCGGQSMYVGGSVMGQITSPALNVAAKQVQLLFNATGNTQTYRQIEGAGLTYQLSERKNEGSSVNVALELGHTLNTIESVTFLP